MMRMRTRVLFLFCLAAMVGATDLCKARLDRPLLGRERFRELVYLPSGRMLKLLACGFDAPLADMLWVQGLVYYSANVRAVTRGQAGAGYRYVYKIYNLVSELNPRFLRAYRYGAMFLFSTGREELILRGIHLLRKGIRFFERHPAAVPGVVSERPWQLYLQAGNAYDMQLRMLRIAAGQRMAAQAARRKALTYYKQAAACPDSPAAVADACAGLLLQASGKLSLEEKYEAHITLWRQLLTEKQSNEEFRRYAAGQLEELVRKRRSVLQTRALEAKLTRACQTFRQRRGRSPRHLDELLRSGILHLIPASPMDAPGAEKTGSMPVRDRWLLVRGGVRSLKLALVQAEYDINLLYDAVFDSFHRNGERLPRDLQQLVREGILERLPRHPLAAAGYAYVYDPATGGLSVAGPGREAGRTRNPRPRE